METRFDQALSHYEGVSDFSPYLKEVVNQLGWSMLLENPRAYQALRDGHEEVAQHYIQQAMAHIEQLVHDHREFKPGRPLVSIINKLGNPKIDYRRALQGVRAEGQRAAGPARSGRTMKNDKRTLDQLIADLGNKNLSDDEAFGRYHRSR